MVNRPVNLGVCFFAYMVIDMAVWKVLINNTFEIVKAENPAEAVERAKQKYLGQLKVKPWIIEIKEVIEL